MEQTKQKIWDVIIIGGGPSGMMCAARAGERGLSVLLLEKNQRLGKKLSITGGGRCNVTNNKPDVREMLAEYKDAGKFLFSTFAQHGVAESIQWFRDRGVEMHEENEGRLFPTTNSAETICKTLEAELKKRSVQIRLNSIVQDVVHDKASNIFTLQLTDGNCLITRSCVIAVGGFSHPETGSVGDGFDWLQKLGHTVHESSLALVPLALKDAWVSRVSGVTLPEVKITLLADGEKQLVKKGKLLFTHVGVSGPTILNMSSTVGEYLQQGAAVSLLLDVFPGFDEGALRGELTSILQARSNQKVRNSLSELLPKALVSVILAQLQIDPETAGHSLSTDSRKRLVQYLKKLPLSVDHLLGVEKAVVSGGGVALEEVDFKTMESRNIPGLYMIGDVLNIDRPSGGYSLQLCWSTGFVAGEHLAAGESG